MSKFNRVTRGRLITDFDNGWALWYGVASKDTNINLVGASSFRVTTDTANPTAAGRLRSVSYDLSKAKNLMVRFFVEDITKLSNIEIRFSSVDNMAKYLQWKTTRWLVTSGWNEVMIPLSKLTAVGGETLDNIITTIQVAVTKGSTGDTSVIFDSMYINRMGKGNVLIHFDDGWLTQYSKAFPILRSYGLVGSIGVIKSTVGTSNYMSLAQLKELHSYGWELFNHTVTHPNLGDLSKSAVETELNDCRDWLNAQGFTESSDIVAYPYGSYSDIVLEVMKDYRIGRDVKEEFEVAPPIQPLKLKVVSLLNDTPDSVFQRAIDIAEETGCTVIFLLHKIEDTATSSDMYSTAGFKRFAKYLHDKGDSVNVLTTNEWVNLTKWG